MTKRFVRLAGLAAALVVARPTAARAQTPEVPVPRDTASLLADTLDALPVVVDFGAGLGSTTATSVDATTSGVGNGRRRVARAQVRLTRAPDSLSEPLARRVASGARIPRIDVVIPGARGGHTVVLHLSDVVVVSSRVLVTPSDVGLAQEQLGVEEAIAQLTAEREEAERQLAALGTLEQRRLSAPLDVARARSTAALLAARLEAQEARLTLVRWRRARRLPVVEELVLEGTRTETDVH